MRCSRVAGHVMQELVHEARAQASDRLQTPEEVAK